MKNEKIMIMLLSVLLFYLAGCDIWYYDADGDGYGDPGETIQASPRPEGYVSNRSDCDDTNPDVYPGATEIPDNDIDENCDGRVMTTWYRDSDSDGFGDRKVFVIREDQPDEYVSDNRDCDDTNPDIHPGATEIPNDIDENCDRFSRAACQYNLSKFGAVSTARVFYPCNMEKGALYGVTTLSGGMTGHKEHMFWLANEIIRQNVIVFCIWPIDNMNVSGFEDAHKDAFQKIKEENTRDGSPLFGRVGAIGVTGFSMGGGAILNVSHSNASDIDVAVAMAPYGPNADLSNIDHPTLIIVGANDSVAPANQHSAPAFAALPDSVPAAYATLPNHQHTIWMMGGDATTKTFIAAWLRWAFYDDPDALLIVQNPPSPIRYNRSQNIME